MKIGRGAIVLMMTAIVLFGGAIGAMASALTDATADALAAAAGFEIDLVLRADLKKQGSWISLAKDDQGRLLLGAQKGQPLTRVTVRDGKVIEQEDLKLPVSEVMGILCVGDRLYVDARGKEGGNGAFGLYRCSRNGSDDHYDKVELLHEWKRGSGEHGAHAIRMGPDKRLYVVMGNFVEVAGEVSASSPHRNFADDVVLPRAEDGRGFGAGNKPPGGSIVRLDVDGKNPELFAGGERNAYDIAFNADGELFGFDSDAEGDWGTPWYRPTRVFHGVSGAEHGFREGTAKWPEYYPDSLPATANIGIGCPTGVVFGYGARFPAVYQKALFILDWTYGRIMAVHFKPEGASYGATWENFVWPKSLHGNAAKLPNNVTGAVIGDDGALYFATGGRNTQGYLYRVRYVGKEPTKALDAHDVEGAAARELRHGLEHFHGLRDDTAVEMAWEHLESEDRFIRYAARIAIESQPVSQWKARALAETRTRAALGALLGLARCGGASSQAELLAALAKFPASALPESQQLDKLRVLEVSMSRQGKPKGDAARQIAEELGPLYPSASDAVNRELCQLLLAVDAPNAVAKSMKLLASARKQEQQMQYVLYLRTISTGWTAELRRDYFAWWNQDHGRAEHPALMMKWFEEAGRPYSDGASYPGFVTMLRADAIGTLSPAEKGALEPVLNAFVPPSPPPSKRKTTRQVVVKNWKMADIEPLLPQVGRGRNFVAGQEAFEATQCTACHRFGNDGGSAGPDLAAISSRFSRRDILESILEPSKVISEQYQNTDVRTKDGDVVSGRVVSDTADTVIIQPNPLAPDRISIKKSEIRSSVPAKLSPMPEGLVDGLTRDELLDLLSYLESGGKKEHPDFGK